MNARLMALTMLVLLNHDVASAQTVIPKKVVDPTILSAIPAETIDGYYEALRSSIRKHVPRIVFVPGILGSKIDECQSDGTQCKPIWGTESSITDSSVDLSIRSDRKYRTDVVDYVFFQDVYGTILDSLRSRAKHVVTDIASDPILTVFPYDWRMSNAENASLLAERICAIRKNAPDSPITIFAHSMGGLLTKVWLKRYSDVPCSGGALPGVTEVVFIATPHLGSPKAIKAFAEGYNLLFDELTGLKRFVGWWERNYLLGAINSAGMTFPSLYELLPIQSSEDCRHDKPKLASLSTTVVGDDGNSLDLFQAESWRYYDLLRRVGSPAIRQSFYTNALPSYLKNSEKLLCELVDYDPSAKFQVTYVVGHEKDDKTFGWFRLKLGLDSSIDNSTNTSGDGTVPLYSAEDSLIAQPRIVETPYDHVSIVNSPFMLDKVDTWFSGAKTQAEAEVALKKAEYKTITVAEAAVTGQLLSPELNAREWSGDKGRIIASINQEALGLMGLTPTDVSSFAAGSSNPEERGRLYAVAASVTTDKSDRATWTNEVAQAAYLAGRYNDAIATSEATADAMATASSSASNKDNGKWADLSNQSAGVKAWAYLRSGNLDKYKSITETASAAGSELKEPQSPTVAQWTPLNSSTILWANRDRSTLFPYVFDMPQGPKYTYGPDSGRCNATNSWCVN